MTTPDDTTTITVHVRRETAEKLEALAETSGIRRNVLVAELLEELVPKIETVQPRRGLVVGLKDEGDRGVRPGQAGADPIAPRQERPT